MMRKMAYAVGVTASTCAACVALERTPSIVDPESRLGTAASSIIAAVRFTRSLQTAAVIMADYRHLFAQHTDYESVAYRRARSTVHTRSADRLLTLARTQGAVYVKIGQHVASMNHAVPREYSSKLKLLEDRAAFRPFWQIERLLAREFAPRRIDEVFDHVEETPVAAASLAQVHRATLRETGESVAVKVQYPGLAALVEGDLTSILVLSRLLKWMFPFFNMSWVVDQFRANLQKELDFALEAESGQRTATFFAGDDRISVPKMHVPYSTRRILVMEYIDGFRIDDVKRLRDAGIDTHAVAQTVVDAFAQMIFVNGFVHCDPHAGNLMVRPKPGHDKSQSESKAFEVSLLDHGLYRELDDEFRQAYCRLWKGLVLRRSTDVEDACAQLGAKGLENLFAIMLLNRSWTSARRLGTDIRVKMSDGELKQLRNDFRASGLGAQGGDLSNLVERIPEDLFLVFKMNALVRNVNKALGASVNRFKVNARYAVRGLRHFNGARRRAGKGDGDASGNSELAVVVASTGLEHGLRDVIFDGVYSVFNWVGQVVDRVFVEINLMALDVAWFAVTWWFSSSSSVVPAPSSLDADSVSESMNLLG